MFMSEKKNSSTLSVVKLVLGSGVLGLGLIGFLNDCCDKMIVFALGYS